MQSESRTNKQFTTRQHFGENGPPTLKAGKQRKNSRFWEMFGPLTQFSLPEQRPQNRYPVPKSSSSTHEICRIFKTQLGGSSRAPMSSQTLRDRKSTRLNSSHS